MATILYKRQKQILDYINRNILDYGCAPTLTEIAQHLGLSSLSTVHEHLAVLEKKGLIRRYKGAVRGIEVLQDETENIAATLAMVELPVLGFIACGEPIEPYTDPNATLAVNSNLIRPGDKSFVLQAKGDSMIDDGILNGDYVVVKEQKNASNGDIVVALVDDSATVKRFFKSINRIYLYPANDNYKPIEVTNKNDFQIWGVVTFVIHECI